MADEWHIKFGMDHGERFVSEAEKPINELAKRWQVIDNEATALGECLESAVGFKYPVKKPKDVGELLSILRDVQRGLSLPYPVAVSACAECSRTAAQMATDLAATLLEFAARIEAMQYHKPEKK